MAMNYLERLLFEGSMSTKRLEQFDAQLRAAREMERYADLTAISSVREMMLGTAHVRSAEAAARANIIADFERRSPYGIGATAQVALAALDPASKGLSAYYQWEADTALAMARAAAGSESDFGYLTGWRSAEKIASEAGLIAPAWSRALGSAEWMQNAVLPHSLDPYRTPIDPLAYRLLGAQASPWWRDAYTEAFGAASAMADAIASATSIGLELRAAVSAFANVAVPDLSVREYGRFLDRAGLWLPRKPRLRQLTRAEKRKRMHERLKQHAEPAEVRQAKRLIHPRECLLREIIAEEMESAYGEAWAHDRLPLCECRGLLARWQKKGGDVLDHADYSHYIAIMCHEEHFNFVFFRGFDSVIVLWDLLKKAGDLRAISHHAKPFSQENLRELRVTWRILESGFLKMENELVVEG